NDAAEGVINAVVDVVAGFAIADGFANDACDGSGGGGNEETARFGEDFDVRGKKDDFVPDKVLLLFGGKIFDVFVHEHELGQGSDIETAASLVKRANDGGLGVGFDGVVGLDFGKMFFEGSVVSANDVVVDDDDGGAVG